jgi:hypothetical protein
MNVIADVTPNEPSTEALFQTVLSAPSDTAVEVVLAVLPRSCEAPVTRPATAPTFS